MAVTVATPVDKGNLSAIELTQMFVQGSPLTNVRHLRLSSHLDGNGSETTTHPLQDLVDNQLGGRTTGSTRVQHHPDTGQTDDKTTEQEPLRSSRTGSKRTLDTGYPERSTRAKQDH